ncbi:probable bifunctional dTTP/UTP pyrophosphatase/methyltransferase protein [Phyllostomus hastatus]|uniref:probable bifunctional dTTP/UTP pyrophosphatase/methyltransferase protein n=1 Tax=Phyllostomus hastatus TaxID=9423 RepID=UPI001E67FBD0|nr:probable bifunctional dTTP/UTP pyrophosphatase/methyltransferase protein [Phyllostomus hastatus]
MGLFRVIPKLLHNRVVMACAAPRHQQVLRNAGLRFTVVPSKFEENLSKASSPTHFLHAMETAKQNVVEVVRSMHQKCVPFEAELGFLQKHGKAMEDADGNPHGAEPPPTAIVELIDGFKVSKALFTACKMKVFDVLRDEGPLSAADVARKIDASEGGTGQLLDVCAALGLLDKTEGGYSNTPLATLYLLSDGEYSLHSFVMIHEEVIWPFFSYLEFAVREGTVQCQRTLGTAGEYQYQESLYQNREKKLQFMGAMHGHTKVAARQVSTAFDLSGFTSACDLGGSTGALAYELARQCPGLKVTVFDLPEVIEDAICFQPDGPQTGQVSFVPGDFFRDTLPEADLYILGKVLHNWPDDKVHQLLSRISRSCKPGGGLLVVEPVLDEDKCRPLPAVLKSLTMMVLFQGRERSLSEYRSLLQAHGFTDVRAVRTGTILDAVLATRA